MRCARCGPVSGVPAVSEIPEIEGLRTVRLFPPHPEGACTCFDLLGGSR